MGLKRFLLLNAVMVLTSISLMGQVLTADVEFRASNFPGREKEFKEAFEAFQKGDQFFLRGPVYFEEAIRWYLKAQEFNPNNADLNFQLGMCYLRLNKDRLKALPYLERARLLKPDMGPDFLYALAQAYHYSYDFDKAIQLYNAYMDALGTSITEGQRKKANKGILECESGRILIQKPIRVRIENLGPGVNSPFPEYSPVLSEDENKLLFTSRREGTTGDLVDPVDSLYLEDIYISYRVDSTWAPAKNVGRPINSEEHDGTISLSPDGKKLLLYRTTGGGDIFETSFEGISWSEPRNIKEINSKSYENHAAYSIDGRNLFFISNRKDTASQGSKDIFVADVDEKGNFSNIRNAGPVINTPYEEDGIYCHPDGKTIYFSSVGHNSMGGYDIFKTTFENGKFSKPENVGYPINSPEDDVFFILSKDEKKGYFASYREEGYGDKDIYVMHFLSEVELLSSLQFNISDTTSVKQLPATLVVKDINSGKIVVEREVENGETIANVPAGKTYEITVKSPLYESYTEVIELPYEAGSQIVQRKVELSKNNQTLVKGTLYDLVGRIPIKGEIEFLDLSTREIVKMALSDKSGNYEITVPPGRNYAIDLRAVGFSHSTDTLMIPANMKGEEISVDFNLNKLDRTLMSVLKGKIFDASTGVALNPVMKITEFGEIPVLLYQKPGVYDCIVFNGATYQIVVNVDGYLTYTTRITVPEGKEKLTIEQDIPMIKAEKGAKIVLNNIFFDFNKSTLRPASYKSLNNLLSTLKRYPQMAIEISGHTDNVGSMAFNQKLSESRANVVRDYLIRNGIDAKRLGAFGRSFRQPIATNDTPAGRQLNRRTEIRILKVQ